ncbi:MAG: mevalonate kinase [Gammaproteobacteria bacterium]|nr:mevalonate kinase [Gammaproteobacteria bacterium]
MSRSNNLAVSVAAKAPAKLIISGEHAVVYGHPSIAIAVDLYAISTVSYSNNKQNLLGFDFANLKYTAKHTINTLSKLKDRAYLDYQRFLSGECSIREVLNKPFELLQFAVSHFLDRLNIALPGGIDLKTHSNIPVGCGMGSSAATILSLLYAVGNLLDLKLTKDKYIELSREAENLQHGKSSGLDLHLTALGGGMRYQNGKFTPINVHTNNLYLIHTGRPVVTTGQCVQTVKKHFENINNIGHSFAEVTLSLEQELLNNNLSEIILLMRENHKLLNYIGVVPEKVNNFITNIEANCGAAKICGAGAVAGDQAGAVLAICPDFTSIDYLRNLSATMGYTMQSVTVDNYGIRIL